MPAPHSGAQAQRHDITIDRQRFHYYTWGDSGPAVVLIHGTGFHGYVWKPLAERLSRKAHVWALDQRGHGNSEKPPTGYQWEAFGDDLWRFLCRSDLMDVTAVGHSAGGTTIAACAAAHPGIIRRAVLADPILIPRLSTGPVLHNPMAHRARKRRMVWESRTAMFHSYRVRNPFKTWREDVLWAYIDEGTMQRPDGQVELKCPPEIEAQVFEQAPQFDGFAVLGQLNIPVLLLRGEHSEAFPPANAARALSLLPNGRLQTVAGTSHFLPMERPDAIERAVRAWMS